MVHEIKRRIIQSIQQAGTSHSYCVSLNSGWKRMRFQLALNKTFCPTPQFLTQQRLKQRQRTKINKTILSAPLPSLLIGFPCKVHNIKIEKQISIPLERQMNQNRQYWSPQLGSQNFILPLIHLIKRKLKIGYPQEKIWDHLD